MVKLTLVSVVSVHLFTLLTAEMMDDKSKGPVTDTELITFLMDNEKIGFCLSENKKRSAVQLPAVQ